MSQCPRCGGQELTPLPELKYMVVTESGATRAVFASKDDALDYAGANLHQRCRIEEIKVASDGEISGQSENPG